MTISNHALIATGIALSVKEPALVLPLAFLSHFVLDAIPHYGYAGQGYGEAIKHKLTYVEIALNSAGIVVLLMTFSYSHWLVLVAVLLALLPDIEWPFRYLLYERKGLKPPNTPLTKFHRWIQWCERPWGIYVEVVFFVIFYVLITKYYLT